MKSTWWIAFVSIFLIAVVAFQAHTDRQRREGEISALRHKLSVLSGQLEAIGLAKKAGDGEIDLQQKALENTLDREKKLWLKSFEADRIITQLTKENTDLKSKVDDVLAQWSETKDEVARFRALNLKQEEELNRLRVDLVTLKQSIEEDQSMTEQNTAIAAFRALQVEDNAATKQKDPPSVPQKPASPRVKRN